MRTFVETSQTMSEDPAHQAAAISCTILIHGVHPTVGFTWQDTFIHDPYHDPQYGAFAVDPVQQYGDAYQQSIFVTDPVTALKTARRQLREAVCQGIKEYCVQHRVPRTELIALLQDAIGTPVPDADPLATLTDDQVAAVWSLVDTHPMFRLARE
jgi:hypothetical protein